MSESSSERTRMTVFIIGAPMHLWLMSSHTRTVPMMAIDVAAGLAAYLGEEWGQDVEIANLSQSTAGARRHNVLFEATAGGVTHHLVATIVPFGETIINPIDAEAAVRDVAEKGGVAVPHVHLVRTDGDLVGGPFLISEFVPGETVPRRVLRLVEEQGNGETVARQLGESLAKLHAIDPTSVAVPLRTREYQRSRRPPPRSPVHGPPSTSCRSADRRWSSASSGWSAACPTRRSGRRSSTATPATATSSSARTACAPCSTGRARWRPATRCRTSPGRRCACGASATTPRRSAASPAGSPSSPATRRRAARSTPRASTGGRCEGTLRWGVGLAGQTMGFLEGRVPSIVMAASGRRVPELEWDLLMLIRP